MRIHLKRENIPTMHAICKMIPNAAFILVVIQLFQEYLDCTEIANENYDNDYELDPLMARNIIIIINLLMECFEILSEKEQFDCVGKTKIHKLLRFLHGYR